MWLTVFSLLLCAGAMAGPAGYEQPDIALTAGIGQGSATAGQLQRMEERLIEMSGRLETLTHTVDTQLAQLDSSVLQLYKEVGASHLDELREAVLAAASAPPPTAPGPDLAETLSQQLQQSDQLLQSHLNDTHQRLLTLLEDMRPAPTSDAPVGTTVIVERCSFQDQFQTVDRWRPADCAAVQQRHQRSGVYTIFPPVCGNAGGIRVYCDMETDGGGWTVLMRRADVADHQDFSMGWQSYKWGFGNLSAEFWLGNEYMNLLTSMDQMQLRVDIKAWDNTSAMATYTPFSVDTEQQKYKLKIGKYEGTAGDSLTTYSNNRKFTTKDQDNDAWSKNCAVNYQNAFWHKNCMHATPTGPYKTGVIKTTWIGVTWNTFKGNKYSHRHFEMKMRPVNYMTWCHKLAQEGARE